MELYVYKHCPYCARARMIFGLKKIPVILHYLADDDEKTPISFTGKKALPVLYADGVYMRESMDIVHYVDLSNGKPMVLPPKNSFIFHWLAQARKVIYALYVARCTLYPFPEFATASARAYFQQKKEPIFGNFAYLISQTDEFLVQLNNFLNLLAAEIELQSVQNNIFYEDDFHLFCTLRCLTMIPEVSLPPKIEQYLNIVSQKTNVPLLDSSKLQYT